MDQGADGKTHIAVVAEDHGSVTSFAFHLASRDTIDCESKSYSVLELNTPIRLNLKDEFQSGTELAVCIIGQDRETRRWEPKGYADMFQWTHISNNLDSESPEISEVIRVSESTIHFPESADLSDVIDHSQVETPAESPSENLSKTQAETNSESPLEVQDERPVEPSKQEESTGQTIKRIEDKPTVQSTSSAPSEDSSPIDPPSQEVVQSPTRCEATFPNMQGSFVSARAGEYSLSPICQAGYTGQKGFCKADGTWREEPKCVKDLQVCSKGSFVFAGDKLVKTEVRVNQIGTEGTVAYDDAIICQDSKIYSGTRVTCKSGRWETRVGQWPCKNPAVAPTPQGSGGGGQAARF